MCFFIKNKMLLYAIEHALKMISRNFDRRVELIAPIQDKEIKNKRNSGDLLKGHYESMIFGLGWTLFKS